jgi:hypothetical protein
MDDRTAAESHESAPVAADLERDRVHVRADRMTAVVRELRSRARFHEERQEAVPAPLNRAIVDFVQELRAAERRIAELTGRDHRPSAARRRRFSRRTPPV